MSLIKRDQGDLKSSEELLDQLFERVNSNVISRTDVLQVYISYMELFLVSGNDELFVNYYNKIKTAHQKNSSLDDILFKESQVAYAQANLVYANFLQSKSRLEESLEYLFLAKELFVSIPQRIINVNIKISNTYYLMGMNSKAKEFIQLNLSLSLIHISEPTRPY